MFPHSLRFVVRQIFVIIMILSGIFHCFTIIEELTQAASEEIRIIQYCLLGSREFHSFSGMVIIVIVVVITSAVISMALDGKISFLFDLTHIEIISIFNG